MFLTCYSDLPYPEWGHKNSVPFVGNLLPSGVSQCLVSWISGTGRRDGFLLCFPRYFCNVLVGFLYGDVVRFFLWPMMRFHEFPFLYGFLSLILQKFGCV